MNKLVELFKIKKKDILSVYFTAGYPSLDDTTGIIEALQESGADLVEIGFPFSDPMADGTVIQKSSHAALCNGMNLDVLFDQLQRVREKINIPVILMGYLNPAYKYGMEKFCMKCHEAGVSGLILPDLPFDIFQKEYAGLYERYDLCYIPLITPQTPDDRVKRVGVAAKGFVYIVSSPMVTGSTTVFDDHSGYFRRVRELLPGKPLLIGFGISDNTAFSMACRHAEGAIVGSAFIRSLGCDSSPADKERIGDFVRSIRGNL